MSFWRLAPACSWAMRALTASRSLSSEFYPERGRERIVDRDRAGALHGLGGDRERRRLSGQLLGGVVRRERDIHRAALAGGDADELVLEPGNEGVRADGDGNVLAGPAFERHAVDRPRERDRHAVAALGGAALGLGGIGPVLVGDLLQGVVDVLVGYGGGELFQLDRLEIGQRDLGHHFQRHRIGEVGPALDHALDLVLVLGHRDLGVQRQLETVIGDDLGVGLAHHQVDGLGHHRAAIDPLEMGDRHLARPEAVDFDLIFHLGQTVIDTGREIARRNDDAELPLEAFGGGFSDLHMRDRIGLSVRYRDGSGSDGSSSRRQWIGRQRSRGVVRAEGFEPPRLSSLEPKSSASTSSATPAMGSARREPIRRAARLISWHGKAPHQKNNPAEIGLSRPWQRSACQSERKALQAILPGRRAWERARGCVVSPVASAARAASMVARSAARLFSAAMRLIMSITLPIRLAGSDAAGTVSRPEAPGPPQSSGQAPLTAPAEPRSSTRPPAAIGRRHQTHHP